MISGYDSSRPAAGELPLPEALRAVGAALGVMSQLVTLYPEGERLAIFLRDGSVVWLRADGWELTKPGV